MMMERDPDGLDIVADQNLIAHLIVERCEAARRRLVEDMFPIFEQLYGLASLHRDRQSPVHGNAEADDPVGPGDVDPLT